MDKVLNAATLKVKTDVETLKQREQEKIQKQQAAHQALQRNERISQRQAEKKMLADDDERNRKIER